MLPVRARLRRSREFGRVVREGRRAGRPALVVHLARLPGPAPGPRVGFVVGRTVGGAVDRNRVRRRLRHLVAARLDVLPADAGVVVRALAPAAGLSSQALGRELDRALDRLGVGREAPA